MCLIPVSSLFQCNITIPHYIVPDISHHLFSPSPPCERGGRRTPRPQASNFVHRMPPQLASAPPELAVKYTFFRTLWFEQSQTAHRHAIPLRTSDFDDRYARLLRNPEAPSLYRKTVEFFLRKTHCCSKKWSITPHRELFSQRFLHR